MATEIEIFSNSIKSAASIAQSALVDGFPSIATAAFHVELDSTEILRLIAIIKPKLLYFHQEWFNYDAEFEACQSDLGLESSDDIDISPLSALKRYDKAYNGKLCQVYVGFVTESVLHLCPEVSEWYSDFQVELEDLSDRLKTVLSENRKKSDLKFALEIARKAQILADHTAFNYNRAGREKRTYLANTLFPDSDWREIAQIVDEATNIDFLSKARQSDDQPPPTSRD